MRNKIIAALCIFVVCGLAVLSATGCTASWNRSCVDIKSNWEGGLDRVVNVYTATGELLAHYEGKIDLEKSDGGYLKFDFEGKRYIYYNCFIETIAEID